MAYKALMIDSDFSFQEGHTINDIRFYKSSFDKLPTLHDYHVIIIDVEHLTNVGYWKKLNGYARSTIQQQLQEQIVSGGLVFCFCDKFRVILPSRKGRDSENDIFDDNPEKAFNNYFFSPIDLGIVAETGDTFDFIEENFKDYRPLKKIRKDEISWNCYFSKKDNKIKPLGVNRAGYPVSIEVSLGKGKLIMLPTFKNKNYVFQILFSEIIPKMIKQEDLGGIEPTWVDKISIPMEDEYKNKLNQIRNLKRLISTNGKALEKATVFALELLGFQVEQLNQGAHVDIRITDGDESVLVEVKGHENRQASRQEYIQLLAFLSELRKSAKRSNDC